MSDNEKSMIRESCRRSYRESGDLHNPFEYGSDEWYVWGVEANNIIREEDQSL